MNKMVLAFAVYAAISGTAEAKGLKRPKPMDFIMARVVECPVFRGFKASRVKNGASEVVYEEARGTVEQRTWAVMKAKLEFKGGHWTFLEGDLSHCWTVEI